MSNEIAKTDDKLIQVLQNSLYTGASLESVGMVLSYCRAANLDPMLKPVHIVPMSVKNPVTGKNEYRDVIMPGVGLYRIQADRSGSLAGITEPEFGPEITREFIDKNNNKVEMTFPEWCKISVKKIIGNHIVEFTSKEYWVENYATDSNRSTAPNAMWKKRPRGQLAKCCEAQSLRKGWPEIGQAPTAEEMEGKGFEERDITPVNQEPAPLEDYPADKFKANFCKWEAAIIKGAKTADEIIGMVSTKGNLTEEQTKKIKAVGSLQLQTVGEFIDELGEE